MKGRLLVVAVALSILVRARDEAEADVTRRNDVVEGSGTKVGLELFKLREKGATEDTASCTEVVECASAGFSSALATSRTRWRARLLRLSPSLLSRISRLNTSNVYTFPS